MVSHLFYYQLAVLALVWLCIMLHLTWPKRGIMGSEHETCKIPDKS
jgi:hypothetical protein